MTTDRDLERLLDAWFADGPREVADRVIDQVADRLEREPQRPAWRLRSWRTPMSPTFKLVAGTAALLVIAVFGYNLLLPGHVPVGGPAPTASPTASPSPTVAAGATFPPVCDDPAFSCAGSLTEGEHSSVAFKPGFTFSIPAGWGNTLDRGRTYTFHAPGNTLSLQVMSQVAIPEQTAGCPAQRKAGAGNTVSDWVTFLTGHPGLVASTPEPLTVGGYSGMRITFHVGTAWTMTCPQSIGPAAFLITDSGAVPARVYWIDDQFTTFTILDVAGETVIIHMDSAPSDAANAKDQQTVNPIVETFKFTPGT